MRKIKFELNKTLVYGDLDLEGVNIFLKLKAAKFSWLFLLKFFENEIKMKNYSW